MPAGRRGARLEIRELVAPCGRKMGDECELAGATGWRQLELVRAGAAELRGRRPGDRDAVLVGPHDSPQHGPRPTLPRRHRAVFVLVGRVPGWVRVGEPRIGKPPRHRQTPGGQQRRPHSDRQQVELRMNARGHLHRPAGELIPAANRPAPQVERVDDTLRRDPRPGAPVSLLQRKTNPAEMKPVRTSAVPVARGRRRLWQTRADVHLARVFHHPAARIEFLERVLVF